MLTLSQIKDKNIFNFTGSKHFFDYLRRIGSGSVDQFLKISDKPSWNKTYTLVNIGNKKKQDVFNEEGEMIESLENLIDTILVTF